MDHVTANLENLGEQVANVSDQLACPDHTLTRVRSRLLQPAPEPVFRRLWSEYWRLGVTAAVGLTAVATIVLAVFLGSSTTPAVHFTIAETGVRGSEGTFVEAKSTPVRLRFSEGTQVEVLPRSGLHMVAADARRVGLLLEHGSARLAVVHRAHTEWTVRSGPFAIRVTGTRFEVNWDPDARKFQLALFEGSVEVTGPHLPQGRRIVAGERLVVELETGEMTISRRPETAAKTPDPLDPDTGPRPASTSAPDPTLRAAVAASPASTSWERLAHAGQYREAFAIVEKQGFDSFLASADAAKMKLLADTARFAGKPRQARQALITSRRRFGARGESAFLLGKIAADQLGSSSEALGWFETYLQEAPRGPLREQALGRSLELGRRSHPDRARTAAQEYLREYPKGAYAPLARTLVEPASPSGTR